MILDFSWLPPEINSARIFGGAGSGPLFRAASAWDGLATDLRTSAASFESVIVGLATGSWAGSASTAMAAAAAPYSGWLSAAAGQAELAAGQARAAATSFETAMTATVHPAAIAANRMSLLSLVATNFLGQNTPAIAATEFDYVEMWAQDVAAMVGYYTGATSVVSMLTPFSSPPLNLAGLASVATAAAPTAIQGAVASLSGAMTAVQSASSGLPVGELMAVAQMAMYPASMLISPMMQLASLAHANTAGLASSAAAGLADVPKFVGDTAPAMKGLGGAGMSAGLGQARLVGAMSVPPSWAGSTPAGMASSAMRGMAAVPSADAMVSAAPSGGGMPMMPMPTGMGAGGAGMPAGMMGRGGAGSQVTQERASVVPRIGVG